MSLVSIRTRTRPYGPYGPSGAYAVYMDNDNVSSLYSIHTGHGKWTWTLDNIVNIKCNKNVQFFQNLNTTLIKKP